MRCVVAFPDNLVRVATLEIEGSLVVYEYKARLLTAREKVALLE
jgi:hypothetical protein